MMGNILKLEFPRPRVGTHDPKDSEEFLSKLLDEFGWDFEEMVGKSHPTRTGNCEGPNGGFHPGLAADGDRSKGFYRNGPGQCQLCYHGGTPARLEWDEDRITLYCAASSGKLIRALQIFHDLARTETHSGVPVDYSRLPYYRAESRTTTG